jgi:dUTP pyrophosphatase
VNIWRCTHCGALVEGLQQIEKHDMECKGTEPGECRICHQAVGVEDGLEDDGDGACHPCRIAELEAALAAAESEIRRYKEREDYFARELGVADGGQYRADWPGAMQRMLKERDAMHKGQLATEIEIQLLHPDAPLPARATEGSAGLDLYAFDPEARQQQWTIPPSKTILIPCGIAVAIPQGYVGLVCPRSGLAIKYSVTVGNAPGVIDSDYRGPVCVILTNHEPRRGCAYIVNESDRIAQLVVVPHLAVKWHEVARLGSTARGEGGFGSTGG